VCADNWNQVEELNERNNCLTNELLCPDPSIDVNKLVWDRLTNRWVDAVKVKVGDMVRFRCTIHNDGCCDLTQLVITDILSDSLKYANNAIPREPDEIAGNTFKWYFKEPLKPCNTITIEFDAVVVTCGTDINIQEATAVCGPTGVKVFDEDTATVVSPCPKPDLVITDKWLDWPQSCTMYYTVKNVGAGPAAAGHKTALYVDKFEVAQDLVGVPLAPGQSHTGYFVKYSWIYTPPSDEIEVCADRGNDIDESDETNNCRYNLWVCGDATGNGKVTVSDGRRIFLHILDPRTYPLQCMCCR
jgi:uncharacterized repeat protein (TIGR01451 family)